MAGRDLERFHSPVRSASGHNVVATLHFYNAPADGEAPFFKVQHPTGAGVKNYSHDPQEVETLDLRPYKEYFTLALHSFQPLTNIAPCRVNERVAGSVSTAEEAKEIINATIEGCREVVVFDQLVRWADLRETLARPVRKVHIDQSSKGAWLRAQRHLSPSTFNLVCEGKLRFRIINIWRPIEDVVVDHPLAFADSGTIRNQDLVDVDHIFSDRKGQTLAVKYNPTQQFWWWPLMGTEDVLLLQCFDSCASARCAHASFEIPDGPKLCRRKSIEIRCLVVSS